MTYGMFSVAVAALAVCNASVVGATGMEAATDGTASASPATSDGLQAVAHHSEKKDIKIEGESATRESPNTSSDPKDIVWRSNRVCGLNCLYLLLRIYGHQPNYVDMNSRLLGEELTNFAQMQDYGERDGLSLRVARFTKADLQNYGSPVIAHFDKVRADGVGYGHFVLVTSVEDGIVNYIDGTTVVPSSRSMSNFQRDWSGYVLHPADKTPTSWIGKEEILAFAAGLLVGGIADASRRLMKRAKVWGSESYGRHESH